MNAINQNNINDINNNTFITNEGDKGKELVRKLLEGMLDGDASFAVIDGELCVLHNTYKNKMYVPMNGVDVVWLDVDDVVENCDIMVRGVDICEYVQDNDAQFALTIIVGDDVDFSSEMSYENRDVEGKFGLVVSKMGYDLFEMILPHTVVNKLVDSYSYELGWLRAGDSVPADFSFTVNDIRLKVVGVGRDTDGCVRLSITDGISDSRYLVKAEKRLMEDKFGNRLDENGEIIPEDDE